MAKAKQKLKAGRHLKDQVALELEKKKVEYLTDPVIKMLSAQIRTIWETTIPQAMVVDEKTGHGQMIMSQEAAKNMATCTTKLYTHVSNVYGNLLFPVVTPEQMKEQQEEAKAKAKKEEPIVD